MTASKSGLTYKDAGVDIDAGEALVDRIAPAAKSTRRPGADAALGASIFHDGDATPRDVKAVCALAGVTVRP